MITYSFAAFSCCIPSSHNKQISLGTVECGSWREGTWSLGFPAAQPVYCRHSWHMRVIISPPFCLSSCPVCFHVLVFHEYARWRKQVAPCFFLLIFPWYYFEIILNSLSYIKLTVLMAHLSRSDFASCLASWQLRQDFGWHDVAPNAYSAPDIAALRVS